MTETSPPTRTLTDRAASAAQWRLAGSLVSAVFQFGIGALLARLLAPADFGLVALAFVVLGLTNLFGDLGMGGALVQRQTLTERHVRTAFTFSVLLGGGLAALIALLAPLGAALMKEPALTPVLRVLAVGFVVRGVSVVPANLLRRDLDFKRAFYVELASYLLGYACLAVVLALSGFGAWSLVWGGLAQGVLSTVLLLVVARHAMRPLLGRQELRDLLGVGAGLTLNGFVNYAATNGDNFVVGRWIGAAGLGLYSRAYALMTLPLTYTASIMSGVLFPAFARVQGDADRMRRGYLLASRVTALSAAPVMAGMAVAAPHLILSIYGPGWDGTVVPLQVLCVAGYFRALYHLGGSVTHGSGKVYQELVAQTGYALFVIAGGILAAPFGLVAVAWAVAGAIVYMYVAMAFLATRISTATWAEYLRAQAPGVGIGVLVGACAWAVRLGLERLGAPSLAIAGALIAVCAGVWGWSMLVAIQHPDLHVLADRIPARLRPALGVPGRVHRRLRRPLSSALTS